MKYIDSHAHYTSGKFTQDRDAVIQRLLNGNLESILECGTNTNYIDKTINLVEKYDGMYAVIGFFPTDTAELQKDPILLEEMERFFENKKVVGLGEIGLDYHHEKSLVDRNRQRYWFIEQLKLAKRLNVPICIHSREAEEDTVEILKNNGKYQGVIHCYSYGVKSMKELLKLGYYFGVGGTVTYKNNVELRSAIRQMPLERILLETDAPYLTPEPNRRLRNDSDNIKYVITELSRLKGVSEEKIIKQTNENCKTLYSRMRD